MAESAWTISDSLADGLIELYHEAELSIIKAARQLDPDSRTAKKADALNRLRQTVHKVVSDLDSKMPDAVNLSLHEAFMRGQGLALDQIAAVGGIDSAALFDIRNTMPGIDAVTRMSAALSSKLRGTHLRMIRWPEEEFHKSIDPYDEQAAARRLRSQAYATDVAKASSKSLLGLKTSHQAQAEAWDRLSARGITGFIDRSGRAWSLSGYVEMATRSTIAQTASQAQLDRMAATGLDLVKVDNHSEECDKCRPWEGKVLLREGSGGARTIEATNPATGKKVEVQIVGTVREAIDKGLMHPNCRHAFTAYIPGLTKLDQNTENPEGEANRKHLRQLERDVRQAKRQLAGSTGATAKKHDTRIKDLQAQIRDHVEATGVRRSRRREQINLALGDEPSGKVTSQGLLNSNTADFRGHAHRMPEPTTSVRSERPPTYDTITNNREIAPHKDPDRYYQTAEERATAQRLRTLGIETRSVKPNALAGKNPEAVIDAGKQTVDFKQVGESTRNAIEKQLRRGRSQTRAIVLDARASGFSEIDAHAQLARALGNYTGDFDQVLFLGNGFEILWP